MSFEDGTRYQAYMYAYPHKTAYRPIEPALALADVWGGERRDALFAYVHVPFCEQRCGFCNLFTRPVPPEELVGAYLDALERQAAVVADALGDASFARAAIGGGTPTLLDAGQLARVISALRRLGATRGIPTSVETSPETALPDRLRVVVEDGGADRVSMGVQSFVEDECRAVNRPQRTDDVHRALRAIRDTGVHTLNLDLMYGLPAQTEATWEHSLRAALEYAPEELYLYPLYVRPLTTLGRKGAEAVDAHRVRLYELGLSLLAEAGYRQVSMRMFARVSSGQRPTSNVQSPSYCCQADGMVGLGCGARSYTTAVHYSSEWAVGARGVRDILDRWVQRRDADFAVADYGFVLDLDEQRRRWLILSLLSDDGVDLAAYRARFGETPFAHYPQLHELAPRYAAETAGALRLTADGVARADAIGPWLGSPMVKSRMQEFTIQ